MATRLQKALEELNAALGGRPYALVFQQSHPDSPVHNIACVHPSAQPFWVTRGLLLEGIDSARELSSQRTELSSTHHRNQENDHGPEEDLGRDPREA